MTLKSLQINKILLTGLLCALYFFSNAQVTQPLISGKVSDSDQSPVEGATVWIRAIKAGTVTDANGSFRLDVPKSGTYTIEVSGVGFKTKRQVIEVRLPASALTVNFILEKDNRQMETLNVTGKTETRKLTESGFNVSGIETKALANTSADLNQVLSRSTGIRIRESGGLGSDFNFSINGLSGKQVKFFIDGIPMENFGNSMSLNNIPVNLAERIEVYKGVVPVELGADALGGAVNIVTNQNVKQYLDMSYSYGSFNTHRAGLSGRYTDEKTGFTINATGFYNYADNNYIMKDIDLAEGNVFVKKDVKRFNDGFRSGMGQVELGFRNKKWADVLLVGLLYSSGYKERQTGAEQDIVYGKVHSYGNLVMPSLKYKKTDLFLKGLSASLFATYAQENTTAVDTSASKYNWEGKIISSNNLFGEQAAFSLYKYTNKFAVLRANLSYAISDNSAVKLNYSLNAGQRSGVNTFKNADQDGNTLDVPNKLNKGILGISLENNLLDGRFSSSIFLKQYRLHSYIRSAIYFNGNGYQKSTADSTSNYFGYGIATRYKITENAGIKASFEHTYRLPEVEELFGDGILVLANPKLKPEESDNINLGVYFRHNFAEHHFSAESSVFYRNAKDFINAMPGGTFSSYANIGKVRITGIDGELNYGYKNLLSLIVNASYMDAISRDESTTVFEERIPNQPWLFGNASFSIGKNDLIGKGTRLQFNWFTQYTHWFYLRWPSRGTAATKDVIPSQTIHNAGFSYSMHEGKYNVSLESRNIFDETAYDSFRLQRPGRSFFVKLRYFIK
jgi:outer membrane cobalamin receptor